MLKKIWTYIVIVLIAFGGALNYKLFVFPNRFAPSGLNGICTMIQFITGISVGYLSLLINIPLAILCYMKVSKPLALRSMLYVVTFSVAIVILDYVDLSSLAYATENGTSMILGPLVAGIVMGFCYSVLIKCSCYTGGIDFVSAYIHKINPEKSVFAMSFSINVFIAGCSYFVYNKQIEPVILCILYSFASTTVGDYFQKSSRSAVRYEIITDYPGEIAREIIDNLHHSATVFKATGAYSNKETYVVMCVINKTQVSALADIIMQYPNTFGMMNPVSQVVGNFKKISQEGTEVKPILDQGDGKTV